MRRLTGTGLIALALLVGFARPASAQWDLLKWLEELSGPGPFFVSGPEATFYCPGAHARAKLDDKDFGLLCDREAATFKHVKFYVGASVLWGSGHNPLTYAGQPDNPHRSVSTQSYAGILGYRLWNWADVASQVGLAHFSAEGTGTVKFFLDPYAAVRPLAFCPKTKSIERLVEARVGLLLFPQGFTLADFGATGGSLTGKAEFVWHLAFLIDFTALPIK